MKRAGQVAKKLIEDLGTAPPPIASAPANLCSCDGSGLIIRQVGEGKAARQVAADCPCMIEKRLQGKLQRAGIPERYRMTTLDGYEAMGGHASLGRALATARRFVAEYPVGTAGSGMLLVGPVGTGKTHLAIGILREAILQKGAAGMFCHSRQLLNRIKKSFGDKSESEDQILQPIFRADLLVFDDLGVERETDWVFDMIENIINTRYNDARSTIITTNLSNRGPNGVEAAGGSPNYGEAATAMRGRTLGDAIGARMYSRLQQMCKVVDVTGDDWRSGKGRR